MRVLVTNDDGIAAPALGLLASRLARDGHDVVVAAPLEGQSGCGASIGQVVDGQFVSVSRVVLSGAENIHAFAVNAPPAFIVLAAVQGLFGDPPAVVVSGPNSGLNLGPLVLHSGTLGAAVTAAANGVPGIALSTEKRARHGYTTAADFCARNFAGLLDRIGTSMAVNVNVPDLPWDEIAGVRETRFAPRSLVAIVLSEDAVRGAQAGQRRMCVTLDYDIDGLMHRKWRSEAGARDDTDAGAIIDRCLSLTFLHGGLRQGEAPSVQSAWR